MCKSLVVFVALVLIFVSLEFRNESLKKRLDKLSKAIASPSDTKGSFVHRMLNESPFPLTPGSAGNNKRPGLTSPDDSINMNVTMELFTDDEDVMATDVAAKENSGSKLSKGQSYSSQSSAKGPCSNTKVKQDCKEYGTTFLKISSAASTSAKQRNDSAVPNVVSSSGLLKHRNLNKQQSVVFREGYNGMGTHDTFIQPLPRITGVKVPKKTSTFKTSLKVAPRSMGKAPPLPSLQGFLSSQ